MTMTWQVVIGALLLALSLLAIVAPMVRIMGWRVTLGIWAFALVLTAMITAGVFLLTGDLS